MKRAGIINAPLSGRLARLGHTDLVVVADAGLPVPLDIPIVDLSVVFGFPRFVDVLSALIGEIVIEHAWVSADADRTPAGAWVDELLPVPAQRLPHEDLKAMVRTASLVIRTGEDTAFSNVVLRCGVPFPV